VPLVVQRGSAVELHACFARASEEQQSPTEVGELSDAIVGFHAQQAAEKASKAALAATGRDFPFTHNIALLMQLCKDAGIELPAALDKLDLLTPYGVAGRYGARSPGTVDRATALDLAAKAVAWAQAVVEEPPSAGSSDADLDPAGVRNAGSTPVAPAFYTSPFFDGSLVKRSANAGVGRTATIFCPSTQTGSRPSWRGQA